MKAEIQDQFNTENILGDPGFINRYKWLIF